MRILRIANILNTVNGGMGRIMHLTADEMRAAGHTIDFVWHDGVQRRRFARSDRFGFPYALPSEVRRRIQMGQTYDIVEVHEPIGAFYCRARRSDRALPPCVAISYGLEATHWQYRQDLDRILGQKTSLKSRLSVPATLVSQAMYTLRHCEQSICINDTDQNYLVNKAQIPAERVSRYHCGVSEKFFVEHQAQSQHDAPTKLLFVGTWLERKGRHFAAQTYVTLKKKYPSLEMSVIGAGSLVEEVLSSFPAEVRGDIHVLPQANDQELLEAYATHDIFLFPTYFEAWGLVLLEAAAAGLAIVTTNALGPGEIFQDGQNALLISPGDQQALTEAVNRLIESPELRAKIGAGARERAHQFSWSRAAQEILTAYGKAIEVDHQRERS